MKKEFIISTIVTLLVLFISGCYLKEASIIMKGIQIQPAKLPPGSRILVCKTAPGMVNYEIKKFRKNITLPGLIVVEPPSSKYKGALLPEIVKEMVGDLSVDMVFVAFEPVQGAFYKEKGSGLYKQSDEKKIKKTVLLNTISCSVYQYDKNAQLMGYTVFSKPLPKEISIDNYRLSYNDYEGIYLLSPNYYEGIRDFQKWLDKNISTE